MSKEHIVQLQDKFDRATQIYWGHKLNYPDDGESKTAMDEAKRMLDLAIALDETPAEKDS